jgi:hypothetical protein
MSITIYPSSIDGDRNLNGGLSGCDEEAQAPRASCSQVESLEAERCSRIRVLERPLCVQLNARRSSRTPVIASLMAQSRSAAS